jgi:hypothetical protein
VSTITRTAAENCHCYHCSCIEPARSTTECTTRRSYECTPLSLIRPSPIPPSIPTHRYENECLEHLLAADMDILMGNIFIVSNRSPLSPPPSFLPSLPDTATSRKCPHSYLDPSLLPLRSRFFSSSLTLHHVCSFIPTRPVPSLRIEQAKQHFDSALGALREGGESGLHPRHAMVLAGEGPSNGSESH